MYFLIYQALLPTLLCNTGTLYCVILRRKRTEKYKIYIQYRVNVFSHPVLMKSYFKKIMCTWKMQDLVCYIVILRDAQ